IPTMMASRSHGCTPNWIRIFEPTMEAVQKKSVAFGPIVLEVGTFRLEGRQCLMEVEGSVHLVPRLGPLGPLNSQDSRSPQRPSKRKKANGPFGSILSGTSMGFSGVLTTGAFVRSQPNPVPFSPQPTKTSEP